MEKEDNTLMIQRDWNQKANRLDATSVGNVVPDKPLEAKEVFSVVCMTPEKADTVRRHNNTHDNGGFFTMVDTGLPNLYAEILLMTCRTRFGH